MKGNIPEEVLVVRFFETGPIDKVEAVFNIVCEKMRERGRNESHNAQQITGSKRRQKQKADQAATTETPQDLKQAD